MYHNCYAKLLLQLDFFSMCKRGMYNYQHLMNEKTSSLDTRMEQQSAVRAHRWQARRRLRTIGDDACVSSATREGETSCRAAPR